MKVTKKKSDAAAQRAWRLLRLFLLWTRKSGVLRRRLMMELRLVPKFLKGLGHSSPSPPGQIYFKERQLSFDETPIFHDEVYGYDSGIKSDSCEKQGEEQGNDKERKRSACTLPLEEEGIDSKADKFIANFYEQMKLQRQISYLEYTEMLNRGAC
ncbi:hypothetical protein GOBAR_DD16181 [Gossypium barbadense]|nr:hypothetical protein GOBAR_DD16181 [Gossypium barbadense]